MEVIFQFHLNFIIMKRLSISPRNNWQDKVEKLGFGFHSINVPYWDESVYYEFSMDEILKIENIVFILYILKLKIIALHKNNVFFIFNNFLLKMVNLERNIKTGLN